MAMTFFLFCMSDFMVIQQNAYDCGNKYNKDPPRISLPTPLSKLSEVPAYTPLCVYTHYSSLSLTQGV